MAAAARNGTLTFRGASGKYYTISMYISDVLTAMCTFNTSGAAVAGSTNFWIIPEDCRLIDFSVATGLTDTTIGVINLGDIPTGSILSWANGLNSLATRVSPQLPLPQGRKLTIVQA